MGVIIDNYGGNINVNHIKLVLLVIRGILTNHIQDLKDIEGDRITNRRTLPIILGAKQYIYLYFIPMEIFCAFIIDVFILYQINMESMAVIFLFKISMFIRVCINWRSRIAYDIWGVYYIYLLLQTCM